MPRFDSRLVATLLACVILGWWQRLPAATVDYDIVYVRAPRLGDDKHIRWADVFGPMNLEAGSDLMLLHPDGKEEVLVAAGKGAVADPCLSFDAQWVYYSYLPDVVAISPVTNTPVAGADVYKINLKTRQVVRLSAQEYTPNTSVRNDPLPYGIYNMGPCPVAGGRVVFTSNRNGFIPPKQYTPVTSQLFIMDDDGANVQPIAPMTLGAALHPFQLKDGRIAFSTQEAQGLRDNRVWAFWAIWPDGRKWEPLMSAFVGGAAFHFATQLTDGDLVVEDYYNLNNMGFGSFHRFPSTVQGPIRFHPAAAQQNPPIAYTDASSNRREFRYPFAPVGLRTITPFATPFDEASAPLVAGGTERAGKVMHPSGAPNNDLLLVWSPGPVNLLARPVNTPAPDAGVYLARGGGPVERSSDLVLVKNDPRYNEMWPRAVVPYRAIYGVDEPSTFPFLPNDGTAHPSLPAGTPYGIIGTSSFYKRESFPASVHSANYTAMHYDGLEPFNAPIDNMNSNWTIQGSDAGKYSNAEIDAVRILLMEPQTEMSGQGGKKFLNHVNERLRVLGEIPLRRTNTNGSPVLDPEGNPDTSFWAKVPADTPISFQLLDKEGRLLTMAQTWHQVRPGELRVDCGGCHAHSKMPLAFEGTAASRTMPVDLTLKPAHDVEYVRDIEPVIQKACIQCHKEPMDSAPARLAFTSNPQANWDRLAGDRDAKWGIKPAEGTFTFWGLPNASRYTRIFQSRRSLLMWTLYEARLDGWKNEEWPSGDQPHPLRRYIADLDYEPGTVDHRPFLTDAQRRMFSAWIDLALPIDQGGGYWRDEIRPTLTVQIANGTVLVGAADGYSGLDEASLSLRVNNGGVSLTPRGDGIWSAPAPAGAPTLVARVKDRAGNWNEVTVNMARRAAMSIRQKSAAPVAASTPQASAAPGSVWTTADGVRFRTELVASALDAPQAVAFAPDGRMFVAEESGTVRIVDLHRNTSTLALSVASAPPAETAILDVALDPDFARSGLVYLYSRTRTPGGGAVNSIARYREAGGRLGQRAVLLEGIPGANPDGRLRFGPDRRLYVTTADNASPSRVGDLGSLAGKVLRLEPDGRVPRDNPLASPIYAFGHRGPAALDWYPPTGDLWTAGTDGDGRQTLHVVGPGDNEGWPLAEGLAPGEAASSSSRIHPAAAFYAGTQFPQFANNMFVATAEGTRLVRVQLAPGSRRVIAMEVMLEGGPFRDVVAGPDGYLYLATGGSRADTSVGTGQILRVVPSS